MDPRRAQTVSGGGGMGPGGAPHAPRSSIGPQSQGRMSKSVISAGTPNSLAVPDESLSVTGGYFPLRLTGTLAGLKIFGGAMLIGLGAAAIVKDAGYARHAAGIWAGAIVIICGIIGAYTVRTRAGRIYVITFLAASLVSLLASILLIIYSATGLAKDANTPYGVIETETGEIVPIETEDNLIHREAAMLINTLLIIIGFLDIIFSLPSVIICLRELCDCYDPSFIGGGRGRGPAGSRDWLINWLGQQNTVFYSQNSAVPYGKLRGNSLRPLYTQHPPFVQIPSDPQFIPSHPSDPSHLLSSSDPSHSHSLHSMPGSRTSPRDAQNAGRRRHRTRSKSPNPRQLHSTRHSTSYHTLPGSTPATAAAAMHHHHPPPNSTAYASYGPLEVYAPYFYHQAAAGYPSPGGPYQQSFIPGYPHGVMIGGPWFYPSADWEQYYYQEQTREERRQSRDRRDHSEGRKRSRSRSKSAAKDVADEAAKVVESAPGGTMGVAAGKRGNRKHKRTPTETDVDKTFSGMDREIGEEFIEQTMEARTTGTRTADQTISGTESEAW